MPTDLTAEAVGLLIRALDAPDTAYILGAGASAPDVPVMKVLIQRVLAAFPEMVTGWIVSEEPGPTHYQFANQAADEDLRDEVLATNIATLRVLIGKELRPAPALLAAAPPQYRVLALARRGVTMINYNVDGLASMHCPVAQVHPVHGKVPDFVGQLRIKEAVRVTTEGIEILPPESYWLPEPEREPVLVSQIDPAYRALLGASTIVIIGYSFGLGPDGIMDQVSYNALRAYCRLRPLRILVVDPAPWRLAEQLGQELKNLKVVPVPAFWHLLCQAILSTQQRRSPTCVAELQRWTNEIVRNYELLRG